MCHLHPNSVSRSASAPGPKRVPTRSGALRPPAQGGFVSFSWSDALILLSMSLTHVHAEDAPVDANCGPRCVDFLVEYVDLPDEQLRSMITEFDALDEQPGVTFQQLAHALERRGPAISADSIPTDFMIESDAPVVLHLNPLGSNSLGHFAVLLPTSTPTHSDVWVGVEGVQSGSPLQLRPQVSGEAIAVSSKPARTAVRALSPLRIAIAENYHWFPVALPGLAIILLALLLMKLRTVPHLSPPVPGDLSWIRLSASCCPASWSPLRRLLC